MHRRGAGSRPRPWHQAWAIPSRVIGVCTCSLKSSYHSWSSSSRSSSRVSLSAISSASRSGGLRVILFNAGLGPGLCVKLVANYDDANHPLVIEHVYPAIRPHGTGDIWIPVTFPPRGRGSPRRRVQAKRHVSRPKPAERIPDRYQLERLTPDSRFLDRRRLLTPLTARRRNGRLRVPCVTPGLSAGA